MTEDGAMQLYTWHVEPPAFPNDAPTLPANDVSALTVVEKQFDRAGEYRLHEMGDMQPAAGQNSAKKAMQLNLVDLAPGSCMLVMPTESCSAGIPGITFTYADLKDGQIRHSVVLEVSRPG